MIRQVFVIFAVVAFVGCQSSKAPPTLAQRVGSAHGMQAYSGLDGMTGDIHVVFNEGLQFDAHFSTDLNTGKTRMVLLDESVLVYDGKDCWISPPGSKITNAKYHLQTWPFLITLPLSLSNAGVSVKETGKVTFGSTEYDGLLLTVRNGGNAGEYTLYVDGKTNFLKAAAVMSATAPTTSPSSPRTTGYALSFYNYKLYDGVFLAQDWKIWQYTPDKGVVGMPIGEARVYNVEFLKLKDSMFLPPAGARKE